MRCVMGVDIGTSSVKALVLNERGEPQAKAARSYRFSSPHSGWAEQAPEDWYDACASAIQETLRALPGGAAEVASLSLSGQMHGLVPLDKNYRPLRPAILHCDTRSGVQAARLAALAGEDAVWGEYNRPYTGFLLSSLLWMAEHESNLFKQVRYVCLPKDYVKWRLCGELSTDFSDASGTFAFDVAAFRWSETLLNTLDIPADYFPPCLESADIAGRIHEKAAQETGLTAGTVCAAGGADQVMQTIGNGAVRAGQATVNIGSSGQVCFQAEKPVRGAKNAVNTFCGFRRESWITMGATMSAGIALQWFAENIAEKDFHQLDHQAALTAPGSEGVLFLPYLNGERTPYTNPHLRAAFLGLGFKTTQAHLVRAVMEGVAFSLRQCAEICARLGLKADELIASGGGAQSPLWLGIQADVYGIPLAVALCSEQAAAGAAITAAVAACWYPSVETAADSMVHYREKRCEPDVERHAQYTGYYRRYLEAGNMLSTYTLSKEEL